MTETVRRLFYLRDEDRRQSASERAGHDLHFWNPFIETPSDSETRASRASALRAASRDLEARRAA